ncbi:ABC transporter substrate-binding protein [Suicoccus acidiformans]|uniref:ABC transporter substrate-binding protein n=1 Tax=Suicoccus acidiformans TaxID=2036206 RepID=A0A347WHQ0_9LACT|nr:ABC transporter substrate-binding protein [Suicoccus acidiformans]AXY24607.1 ABC transporter substrate-binding protein [Suicoccus acidiformans]
MKKFMRKFVSFAMTLAVALGTFAPAFTAQAQEPVELVFWHAMGGSTGEALQALVDQFNESQADIHVTAQYQGSYDETLTKLRSQASGSEVGADLVQVFELGTTFMIDSGLTVPVQEFIDANNYDISQIEPNLAAYYTINEQLHSMPFNSSTPIMYYNKDLFEAAGIEEVPSTLAEIIEVGPQLVEAGAAMPISLRLYGWFIEQWFSKQQEHIYNNGNGREAAPTETVFVDNGAMEKTIAKWKEGSDAGLFPNVGREGGQPEFVSGQSAMMIGSTASLRQILTEVDGRFEVGTAYFPGVDAEDQGGVSIGGASLWMINSGDDAKKDATWKFIEFLISPEAQAQWNRDTGYFPVTTAAHDEQVFKDNLAEFPQFQTAIDQLHDSAPEDQGALSGVNQEARQIYESELENLLNGQGDPASAAKSMADQVNAALENYNTANQ